MFKIYLTIFLVVLIVMVFVGYWFFQWLTFSLNEDNNSRGITLEFKEEDKSFLKKVARKLKSFIYKQATEHNPEGDVLPDEIDDRVIDEVRELL